MTKKTENHETKQPVTSAKKKSYTKPELKEYGAIHEFTKAITATMTADGGVAPSNRTMNCVSIPSYLEQHRWLLQDGNVQSQFQKALAAQIKPGDVVLDLGAGTGLHSFFAARAGAARVYAVDTEPILEAARLISESNGFQDKIIFIQQHSDQLELPEKVDAIVTNLGFFATLQCLPSVIRRFLKPDGKVIPQSLRLGMSLLEDSDFYQKNVRFWQDQPWGLNMASIAPMAACRPLYNSWMPEKFLSEMVELDSFDLKDLKPVAFSSQRKLKIERTGVVHGIVGWYTYDLGAGFSFSTRPPLQLSRDIWNQWVLPLSSPLKVSEGDVLDVSIQMNLVPGYEDAVWRWEIRTDKEHRKQSSFDSIPLGKVKISDGVPAIN